LEGRHATQSSLMMQFHPSTHLIYSISHHSFLSWLVRPLLRIRYG
jgi:hypothetical protein